MLMVISMMACGRTTKHMDLVSTFIMTEPNMKAIGKTILNTAEAKRTGQTVPHTMVSTRTVRKMVKALSSGVTIVDTKVNSTKTIFME